MAVTVFRPGPDEEALRKPPLAARLRWSVAICLALLLLAGGYALVLAQVTGDRGISATASSADIEVRGIELDIRATTGEEARAQAWRRAQREAWTKVGGPPVSDSQLSSMVSAIVIERERIGPRRYVATLGVTFDRQRAGRFLGGTSTQRSSAPMLLLPVTASGGAYTTFELRNPWQRAWAQFNPGRSRIDYVRPSGAGGDSLLLNFGQAGRRSRAWWRTTLDQYGAADALLPVARLEHQFPGGPITGTFTARYGPDSRFLESFELTAASPTQLPEMLAQAVERMDAIFEQALVEGKLRPDPGLRDSRQITIDPAIERLLQISRAIQERDSAEVIPTEVSGDAPIEETATPGQPPQPPAVVRSFSVQFATPDAASFDATLTSVRQVTGVRGLAVTSTAIGGTSVMNVSFGGEIEALAAALRSRGFTVREGSNALAISR